MKQDIRSAQSRKKNWQVTAEPKHCCMCLMCQLVCSLATTGVINPSKARIRISKAVRPDGTLDVGISFTNECNNCGICAKYCLYGALSKVSPKEAN